jgi:hypothetical protein
VELDVVEVRPIAVTLPSTLPPSAAIVIVAG